MKRVFTDLHMLPNVRDSVATTRMINKAAELGYLLIAVPLAPETSVDEVAKLREACREAEMDFASRVDLRPRTSNELTRQLRRLRRKFEIVCVNCENKAVARQAAKDRRVDLLNFPHQDFHRRFFDRAEAELASNSLAALEIDVKPLLVLERPARIRLLSNLRREATIAKKFGVSIVVSSGATAERFLRKPREMATLAFLFGSEEASALDAVSRSPEVIVKRNREKLGSKFVAPGIRVIRKGCDC